MSWFSVDTAALETIAGHIGRTRAAVTDASRQVADCHDEAAAGFLAGAVAGFDEHWHYGLHRLVGSLDACDVALRRAAQDYRRVDGSLARAADTGTGTQTGTAGGRP